MHNITTILMSDSIPEMQTSTATGPDPETRKTAAAEGIGDPSYPLKEIALLIRHFGHDLRNTLNGMDLDLTLVSEANGDPGTLEAIKRLQGSGAEIGRQLQGLMAKYGGETPFVLPVVQIAERWKMDASRLEREPEVHWRLEPSDSLVCGEAGLIRNLLWEMFRIAARISATSPLRMSCACADGKARFTILIEDAGSNPRRVQPHHAYWASLRRLAERSSATILPSTLDQVATVPIQLILSIHEAVS